MVKRIITLFLLSVCLLTAAFGQSKKDIKKAREMISYYDYAGAIALLEKTMRQAKDVNPEAVEALAECYRKTGDLAKAETTYSWLLKMDRYDAIAYKHYGEILMYFEDYASAKEQFQRYLSVAGQDPLVNRLITSCDTAMRWMIKRDSSVFEIREEKTLNTKYAEWGALLMKDGRNILYISDRPTGNKGKNKTAYRPFRVRKPVWSDNPDAPKPRTSSVPIYTSLYEGNDLGPIVYSANGRKMFYTHTSSDKDKVEEEELVLTIFERKLEIEEADLVGNAIRKTKSFDYNNPTEYSVEHPCLSPDGRVLYFVSDMPGGYGGMDIYFSVFNAQGYWSEPVNAGPVINTEGNELFPTMDEFGILYFSSNGHPGYGGMDIFRAKGSRNKWVAIENLRAPVNSGGDDFSLSFNPGTEDGYFASNRRDGTGGDDIYSFRLTGPLPDIGFIEAPQEFIQSLEKKAIGYILDEETDDPIDSVWLCAIDKATNTPSYAITDSIGMFVLDLEENTEYVLSCIKDGFIPVIGYEFTTGDRISMRKLRLNLKMKHTEPDNQEEIVIRDNIVLDLEQGVGIEYSVQILANREYPDWKYLDKAIETYPQYKIYYGSFPDTFTRFTIGRFKQLKKANQLMAELRKIGYSDAFVVMFVDGKRKVVSYH